VLLFFGSHAAGDARIRAKLGTDIAMLRSAGVVVLSLSEPHGPLVELT
jgi:hypothetical protein